MSRTTSRTRRAASRVAGGAGRSCRSSTTQIARRRRAGALVVYTQDWHPQSTPHFAKDGGIWPVHCVAETWGAELHPDLGASTGPIVRKGANGEDGYSGFTMREPDTGERRCRPSSSSCSAARGVEAGRRLRPGHRLLRPGHRPRRDRARLRDHGPRRRASARSTSSPATASGRSRRSPRPAPASRGARAPPRRAGHPDASPHAGRGLTAAGVGGGCHRRGWLGALIASGDGPDPTLKMAIAIDAPIETVWEVGLRHRAPAALDARDEVGPAPHAGPYRRRHAWRGRRADLPDRRRGPGRGRRIRSRRIAFGIRHVGVFAGSGRIRLEALDASRTLVRWDERLVPPAFPNIGQLLQKPILGAIFQADLERLRRWSRLAMRRRSAGGADGG